MALVKTKSYGHSVDQVIPTWRQEEDNKDVENYVIYWKWDYRDARGLRATQSRCKRTNKKSAERFAKKHNINMFNE
jgi:hypothetical protein